jgi:hypothetical protein
MHAAFSKGRKDAWYVGGASDDFADGFARTKQAGEIGVKQLPGCGLSRC